MLRERLLFKGGYNLKAAANALIGEVTIQAG
jgi:hypothetical protein